MGGHLERNWHDHPSMLFTEGTHAPCDGTLVSVAFSVGLSVPGEAAFNDRRAVVALLGRARGWGAEGEGGRRVPREASKRQPSATRRGCATVETEDGSRMSV
jgi:hypothetical protein